MDVWGRASGGTVFSALPEKTGEKRGAGLRFGACCGYNSSKSRFFSRFEHTYAPCGRYGARRLLWYTDFSSSCDSISAAKSLAFETCRVVRIRRSSFWCRTGAGAPLASPGGSWLRSEAEQTDEGRQQPRFASDYQNFVHIIWISFLNYF